MHLIYFSRATFTVAGAIKIAIATMLFASGAAHAEFRLGLTAGAQQSEATFATVMPTAARTYSDRSSSVGAFAQYRYAVSPRADIGIHFGTINDDVRWRDERVSNGTVTNIMLEPKRVHEILAVFTRHSDRLTRYAMAGYSGVNLENGMLTVGGTTHAAVDQTLNGWKVVLGVEFPLLDIFIGHIALHHARYDARKLDFESAPATVPELELRQSGIQFGWSVYF